MRSRTFGALVGLAVVTAGAAVAHADVVEVFATGVADDGTVLAPGNADPHWTIVQAPAGVTFTPPSAATVATAVSVWVQNDPVGTVGSSWIASTPSGGASVRPGTYVFRTTADLTGLDPATAVLTGRLASDNTVSDIRINGTSTGTSGGIFGSFAFSFQITQGFVDGPNTIDVYLENLGQVLNPMGVRIELTLTADPAVVADTTAPEIFGCADATFEWGGSDVPLDAATLGISATDDVDGDLAVTLSPASVGLGTHTVVASATDAAGNVASCEFQVTVADTAAPVFVDLSAAVTGTCIDGRRFAELVVTAATSDAGDAAPTVRIVEITSQDTGGWCRAFSRANDEPQITGPLTALVRADAFGRNGRTYEVTVEALDASGNSTLATLEVEVSAVGTTCCRSRWNHGPSRGLGWGFFGRFARCRR